MAAVIIASNNSSEEYDWKKKYEALHAEHKQLDDEFNEFQAQSRQLEGELEKNLRKEETKVRDLQRQLQDAQDRTEDFQRQLQRSHSASISYQEQLDSYRSNCEELEQRKRDLEIQNDELERLSRALQASVLDLNERNEKLQEENIVFRVTTEATISNYQETIQRLSQDLREHQVDVEVRTMRSPSAVAIEASPLSTATPSTKLKLSTSFTTPPSSSPQNRSPNSTSMRSPLAIVNEMLQTVKELEVKMTAGWTPRPLSSPS